MYGKIFSSLFEGSLLGQPHEQLVFIYILSNCDPDGCFDKVPQVISTATGLSLDHVNDAIERLSQPDPHSRTPEEEGRRLVLLDDHRDWGWRVVNYEKYQRMRNAEQRRKQNREAQQRARDRKKSARESAESAPSAPTTTTTTRATATTTAIKRAPSKTASGEGKRWELRFAAYWESVHRKVGKRTAESAFKRAVRRVSQARKINLDEAAEIIILAQREFTASPAASPTDHTPIHPTTWLNGDRWEDDRMTWQDKKSATNVTERNLKF